MTNGILAFAIVFGFLQVYAAMAAIDFGAGVLYLIGQFRKDDQLSDAVLHYMSPVWETTGVFIICFVVGLGGFFPGVVEMYSSALIVPATIALLLLVLRGVAFTHAHNSPKPGWLTVLGFGLSSLLIPLFFAPFFTVTEVGLTPGHEQLQPWTHPLSWAVVLVGLAFMWSLSSTFLASWVQRRAEPAVSDRFARIAQYGNAVTVPAAGVLLIALQSTANYHFQSLVQLWPLGLVSAVLAVLAAVLVHHRGALRTVAFIFSMVSFVLFFAAYGWSRMPYLIYPNVTVDTAVTGGAMFNALLATLVVGLVLLVPALLVLAYFATRGGDDDAGEASH
jgi:cytochrome d ubiquinol oxidase subunit II